MGKGDRSSSGTCGPQETSQPQINNIPTMFRTSQGEGHTASASPKHSIPLGGSCPITDGAHGAHNSATQAVQPSQHTQALCLSDLQAVALDTKANLSAAITDLKADIQGIAAMMGSVEQATARHADAIKQVQKSSDMHLSHIIEIYRHLEDLNNRGRHHTHNIRIRGVPELTDQNPIEQTAATIFNDLLDRPPDSPIKFERIHRALRPRGRDTDPPRDIICCLVNLPLTEAILNKAREKNSPLQWK